MIGVIETGCSPRRRSASGATRPTTARHRRRFDRATSRRLQSERSRDAASSPTSCRRFSLVQGRRPRPGRRHRLGAAVGAAVAGVGGRAGRTDAVPTLDGWTLDSVDLERDGERRRRPATRIAPGPRAAHHRRRDHAAARHRRLAQGRERARGGRPAARPTRPPRRRSRRWPPPSPQVDVVTAALDGFRTQLLGLADGRRRCSRRQTATATIVPPAPTGAAHPARRRARCGSTGPGWSTPSAAPSTCPSTRSPSTVEDAGRGRARRAAAAARASRGRPAGSSASSTRRRPPGARRHRGPRRPGRPDARRSTRSPASCCPTTSTRASRSSAPTAARSASCSTSPSAAAWCGRSPPAARARPTPGRATG